MGRTQGDLIDELTKRVDTLALALEGVRAISTLEIAHIKDGLKDIQVIIKDLQLVGPKLAERVATLEQRCAALEKVSDRGWQVWLALLGALLALAVTLFRK